MYDRRWMIEREDRLDREMRERHRRILREWRLTSFGFVSLGAVLVLIVVMAQ